MKNLTTCIYNSVKDAILLPHPMVTSIACRVHCKILEHIVCSNIMANLNEYKLLSDKHHAFRKWHSCEAQLTTVIDDWAKVLDKHGQIDIYMTITVDDDGDDDEVGTFLSDFDKAFDTPPHELKLII